MGRGKVRDEIEEIEPVSLEQGADPPPTVFRAIEQERRFLFAGSGVYRPQGHGALRVVHAR